MTHPTQSEAERLADVINMGWLENVDPDKADVTMIQAELRRLSAENEQLLKEVNEQARLNGMGAERELALRARVAQLEAERVPMTDERIEEMWATHIVHAFGLQGVSPIVFAREIEHAHGIKATQAGEVKE